MKVRTCRGLVCGTEAVSCHSLISTAPDLSPSSTLSSAFPLPWQPRPTPLARLVQPALAARTSSGAVSKAQQQEPIDRIRESTTAGSKCLNMDVECDEA